MTKINVLFAAIITALVFTGVSAAQSTSLAMHDEPEKNLMIIDTAFPSGFLGGVRVATADLPAATRKSCLASADFSRAVPMDPSLYTLNYNTINNTYEFSFGIERDVAGRCTVVRLSYQVGNDTVDARDYIVWRKNLGTRLSGLTDENKGQLSDAKIGNESERAVRFSLVPGVGN